MSTATIESPERSGANDLESHLIVQIDELRDENSRSRLREALWISIIFHFIVLFSIRQIPHWWPTHEVKLQSQAESLKQRELTYIEQPPDKQRVEKAPQTDKISDKNRIAASKAPQIDRRTLEKLARSGLSGAPGMKPDQPPTPPQVAQQQSAQNTPPAPPQSQPAGQPQPPTQPTQSAKLEQPPLPRGDSVFRTSPSVSAGTAIEQAARASASARAPGVSGDYGGGFGRPNTSVHSDLEIMTDTMGVDFSPYMQRVLQAVRMNWY